jgi:riboflavin kinase/FMN adenylyltransferase
MTDIFRGWKELPRFRDNGSCVTWGVFDGVHLGHQDILNTLVDEAEELGTPSVILTFDPHPVEVLRDASPDLICSVESRVRYMQELGPDVIAVVPFTDSFSDQTPEEFYESILRKRLNTRGIVLGEGARFGRNREGDIDRLKSLSTDDNVTVTSCDHREVGGERISSTRLRKVIESGDLDEAETLLGRPFEVTGQVVRGEGRGREIGYPTANLELDHDIYPPRGIYGGVVPLSDGVYPAVTSIGVRPTFDGGVEEVVEVHILNFSGDLYDRVLRFKFLCFLREEEEYDSAEELVEQIERDISNFRDHPSHPQN